MKDKTIFTIDNAEKTFSIQDSPKFKNGKNEVLSSVNTDITYNQPWYRDGYTEKYFLNKDEFITLQKGINESIIAIVKEECSVGIENFKLENYHEFVTTDIEHFKVVARTRDLFSKDFGFDEKEIILRLEQILGFGLTDIDPKTKKKLHIIVRINRPQSKDFNPPHKDIYEGVDNGSYIPQFVNFWIPIAGVNDKSNLPLAPKSHQINERQVLRTFDGGIIEGNKYRVRMIKSWNGKSDLVRSKVKYGEVLIFSGHLIHGLAVNDNSDKTRVALEFRLFKS